MKYLEKIKKSKTSCGSHTIKGQAHRPGYPIDHDNLDYNGSELLVKYKILKV